MFDLYKSAIIRTNNAKYSTLPLHSYRVPTQNEQKYTGQSARDTAEALDALATGVATLTDRKRKSEMVDHAIDVMDKSRLLIDEAKSAVTSPNAGTQDRLAQVPHPPLTPPVITPARVQVAKAVSISLNKCVNCLPGLSDVDYASKRVLQESNRYNDVPVSVPVSSVLQL